MCTSFLYPCNQLRLRSLRDGISAIHKYMQDNLNEKHRAHGLICFICQQLDWLHVKNGEALALCPSEFLVHKAQREQEMLLSDWALSVFWGFLKCEGMGKTWIWTEVLSPTCPESSCSVLNCGFQTLQDKIQVSTRPLKEFRQTKLAHSYWAALLELRPQLSNAHTTPVCSPAKRKLSRGKKNPFLLPNKC